MGGTISNSGERAEQAHLEKQKRIAERKASQEAKARMQELPRAPETIPEKIQTPKEKRKRIEPQRKADKETENKTRIKKELDALTLKRMNREADIVKAQILTDAKNKRINARKKTKEMLKAMKRIPKPGGKAKLYQIDIDRLQEQALKENRQRNNQIVREQERKKSQQAIKEKQIAARQLDLMKRLQKALKPVEFNFARPQASITGTSAIFLQSNVKFLLQMAQHPSNKRIILAELQKYLPKIIRVKKGNKIIRKLVPGKGVKAEDPQTGKLIEIQELIKKIRTAK